MEIQDKKGPFRTEVGSKTIMQFASKDILPTVSELESIAIKTCQYKSNISEFIFKPKLRKIENEFRSITNRFFNVYHTWNTPDILFKDIEQDKDLIIVDYFIALPMLTEKFIRGFQIFDFIDKIITNQNTAYYNRLLATLSMLAILISIFSILR